MHTLPRTPTSSLAPSVRRWQRTRQSPASTSCAPAHEGVSMNALYYVSHEASRVAVMNALERLPADVSEFVNTWCLFIGLRPSGNSSMVALHVLDATPAYLILLDQVHMEGPLAQDIVAHEVAHA